MRGQSASESAAVAPLAGRGAGRSGPPTSLSGHSVFAVNKDKLVVYGGQLGGSSALNADVWVLDLRSYEWTRLQSVADPRILPRARWRAASCKQTESPDDPSCTDFLIFGGSSAEHKLADLFQLSVPL